MLNSGSDLTNPTNLPRSSLLSVFMVIKQRLTLYMRESLLVQLTGRL